ncbi:phage tail assembly chaperone [Kaustia mangrovi]|uniref:Phage tail assembly chaperone n=1 Tax=Kaustia mangrovi TaxID=2593653 RepID=A0A7S8C259_9HYPH|nr:rcc01693 family protein [Kaustia mangrovi]QPC41991.1 phage tail assembly chaperone [Kaustia mangrovi]
MSAGARFPWRALMGAGLGALRLAPPVFWAMTPRELMVALHGAGLADGGAAPPARADLDALMSRFPDR